MSATSISVSRTVPAPTERVFALLADPDRHPDLDATGMVRHSKTHLAITELGDVFLMQMHHPEFGDYEIANHVVVYEQDRAIGWAPGSPGEPPGGHTYVWRLEETDDPDTTLVTQTYDWSAVTDPELVAFLPVVGREALAASLDRLADALA